jgi:acyl-[acyl-carrier-protein] desaturase
MNATITVTDRNLLAELEPAVERAMARHLDVATEWFPHEYVPYEVGRNYVEEPWVSSDSPLDQIAQTALELNLLTEDNLPFYHLALYRTFGADGPWAEWSRRWTAEEGRHSIVLRDYLTVTRGLDPTLLERGRMDHVSRGYYRDDESAADVLVYVTFQELATRIAHRHTGEITGDPLIEKLTARIATDENLHYVFYRNMVSKALEIDPSAVVLAIKRQVLGFSMPGLELPGFREKAISIASAGIYDLRIHRDQVLVPVLMKHWGLTELQGLSEEAEQARDEILAFLGQLDQAASRYEEKRAS